MPSSTSMQLISVSTVLPLLLFGVCRTDTAAVHGKLLPRHDTVEDGYLELDLHYTDGKFLATLQLGSNDDVLHVLVDTGSSDLWVPGSENSNCAHGTNATLKNNAFSVGPSQGGPVPFNCSVFGTFDYRTSTSYAANGTAFEIVYGGGAMAMGEWGHDSVSVGGSSLGEINFAVAANSSKPFGVLGIGFPGLESTQVVYGNSKGNGSAAPHTYENFPQRLKTNRIIARECFSLLLDQDATGQLLFGAIDHSKYRGSLYRFPMVNAYLTADSADVDTISATLNSFAVVKDETSTTLVDGFLPAVFDSGTAFATLPYTLIELLRTQLDLTTDTATGITHTNCSQLASTMFRFDFQGVPFDVPALNFFLRLEGGTLCGLAAAASYVQGYVVLGQAFLDSIYLSADLQDRTVALAYANLPAARQTDADIELLPAGLAHAVDPPSTQTYDISHMLYSAIPLSTVTLASSINYAAVYTKSLNVAETSASASYSSSATSSSATAPRRTPSAAASTNAAHSLFPNLFFSLFLLVLCVSFFSV